MFAYTELPPMKVKALKGLLQNDCSIQDIGIK